MTQDKYIMFNDSQCDIRLAKNPITHSQTKHIVVRYHWIQNVVNSKLLDLENIHTDKNGPYTMTNILSGETLQEYCKVEDMMMPPQDSEGGFCWISSSCGSQGGQLETF